MIYAIAEWNIDRITICVDTPHDFDGSGQILCLEDPEEKDKWTHGIVNRGQIILTKEAAKLLADQINAALVSITEMDKELDALEKGNSKDGNS